MSRIEFCVCGGEKPNCKYCGPWQNNDVTTVDLGGIPISEDEMRGNKTAQAQTATQKQNGIQRLELKDLTVDKKRCRLLWAGDPKEIGINQDWATVSIKIQSIANGQKRLYTMGNNNPLLSCLDEAFGGEGWEQKPETWQNRELMIWKAIEGIQEKEFIRFAVIGTDGQEIPFDYSQFSQSASAGSSSL